MQYSKLVTLPAILHLTALAAVLALMGAYVAEYVFRLMPCELCLMQRKPFFAVIALWGLWLMLCRNPQWLRLLLLLMALLMAGNAALALYHSGVEKHWWQGPTECSGGDLATGSLEDIRAQILAAPLVRCDVPAWEFHGITMAALNVLYCGAIALFLLWRLYATPNPART